MWLTNSSIGRKVIMSVTGIALILFLTFHACMNLVVLFDGESYNTVCEMLGANWYAVVATIGLAVLVAIHFIYAIVLHLYNFWYNMMFAELVNGGMPFINEVQSASDGAAMIAYTFKNPVSTVLYLVWFAALWFHLTLGFWSALQTLGWSGKIWFNRWRVIGNIYVSILMLIFVAVALAFAFCGGCCAA